MSLSQVSRLQDRGSMVGREAGQQRLRRVLAGGEAMAGNLNVSDMVVPIVLAEGDVDEEGTRDRWRILRIHHRHSLP